MASKSLGVLTLDLVAKTGMFEAGLDKAGRKMTALEKKAFSLGKNIGTIAAGVGTAVGAAVVAGATAAAIAVDKAIDQMDELYNASQKIGIPVEVLSGFKYAAELSGVSIDQLQTGMGKLVKFQQDAAQGGKESTRVFEAFGIAVKDAEGNLRKTQDLIKDFADVFKALPDGPEQAALALQVFGKSGLELVPLLNAGSDGIQNMIDRAKELGLVFDEDAGAKADEFNDKIDELKGAVGGLATQVAIELLPELISLVDWFRENYTEGTKLKETAEAIAAVMEFAGDRIASFSNDVQALSAAFAFGVQQVDAYYQAVTALASLDFEGAINAKNRALANVGNFAGTLADINKPAPPRANFGRVTGGASGSAIVDRLAQARTLNTALPKSAKAGKKDNSEEERLRAEKKAAEDYKQAIEALNGVLDDQARITGGDLTKAAMDYRNEMVKILETETQLRDLGKLDAETQVSINQARDQATAAYQKEVAAIQSKKSPMEELLADMQFENDLLKMNNEERLFAIQTRGMDAESVAKYGDSLKAMNAEMEATNKQIDAMDEARNSATGFFTDILDGSKSAKDAFKDFADSIIQQLDRMVAEWLTAQLFGQQGTTGGGSAGGWLGSLFSMFASGGGGGSSVGAGIGSAMGGFGGGLATGGNAKRGMFYEVNESGPEMLSYGNRDYLMMGNQSGTITPNHMLGKGGGTNNITINVPPTTQRKSAQQIAMRTEEKLRTATHRNM